MPKHVANPGRMRFTSEGGLAVRVFNNTGVTLLKGYVVKADSANDDAVVLTATSDPDPIGIVYEDIDTASWGWVVILGIADGYLDNAGAVTREQWVGVSTANAGQMTASGIPTGTGDHFRECGHTLRARGAGSTDLVRMIIHFN
jgi:hypothetical protein